MKEANTLASLIENPQFGLNKLVTEAVQRLTNGVVTGYSLTKDTVRAHIVDTIRTDNSLGPAQMVQIHLSKSAADQALKQKIVDLAYHEHGEVLSDDFKADFLPVMEASLAEKYAYGADAEVTKVHAFPNGRVQIYFTSTREIKQYDELGEELGDTISKVSESRVMWELENPTDTVKHVTVPRPLFKTAKQFKTAVATALNIDASRFNVDAEVENSTTDETFIKFDGSDLTYSGFIKVLIPASGEEAVAYLVDSEAPEEPVEEEENTDPTSGVEDIITGLNYNVNTGAVEALIADGYDSATISVNGGVAITAEVIDGLLSHQLETLALDGDVITVTVGEDTDEVTVRLLPLGEQFY